MKKAEKIAELLNEQFRTELPKAFKDRYDIEIITKWSFLSMALYSERKDGKPLTEEQALFVRGFELGYLSAMQIVQAQRWQ